MITGCTSSVGLWLNPPAVGGWVGTCGSVLGLWGVLLWLGGCRAMAKCGGSVSGACWASGGSELVIASELWGGTATP